MDFVDTFFAKYRTKEKKWCDPDDSARFQINTFCLTANVHLHFKTDLKC